MKGSTYHVKGEPGPLATTTARRRIMLALFSTQGLFTASIIAIFTVSPILAAELSGSDSAAGLPNTINLAGRALLAAPAGLLMDRAGRRLGLSLGYLVGAAGAVLGFYSILVGSFPGFLASAALFGMMRAAAEQARFVAHEVYPDVQGARAIGLVVFAGTLGAIGGPLLVPRSARWALAWGLPESAGPFALAALMLLGAMLLILLLMRPDPRKLAQLLETAETPGEPAAQWGLAMLFEHPLARLAVLSMGISQLVMMLLMVVTPLHMSQQAQGTMFISLVIMAHTLGMFGLSWLGGWLIGRLGAQVVIIGGTLLLLLAAVITPLVQGVAMLALALFLLGLGWSFCFVAGSALLAQVVPPGGRGRLQGASESFVSVASGAGSLGAGLLFVVSGLWLPAGIGLLLALTLLTTTLLSISPRTRAINNWRRAAAGGSVLEIE